MKCALFMFVLFTEAILTPEATLFGPCLFGTVILFELAGRTGGKSLSTNFIRTWRCLAVGAVLSGAWVIYLVSTRSLSAFIELLPLLHTRSRFGRSVSDNVESRERSRS